MEKQRMRVWSRYGLTTEMGTSYEVIATDNPLSALEVDLATRRVKLWESAHGGYTAVAERMECLTAAITERECSWAPTVQPAAYPEGM